MAKKPLEVGEQVWIEAISSFFRHSNDERKVIAYEVVDANRSSAYVVAVSQLDEFNENPKKYSYLKRRVEQRSHSVKEDIFGTYYVLWLTKEAFENNVIYNDKIEEARRKAHEKINQLSLDQLNHLLGQF